MYTYNIFCLPALQTLKHCVIQCRYDFFGHILYALTPTIDGSVVNLVITSTVMCLLGQNPSETELQDMIDKVL